MSYDMHGSWDSVTGHNAGLHKGDSDEAIPREQLLTVDVAVEYWLREGCPPEKLVLGVPFYGRTFKLQSESNTGVRAPTDGAGIGGPYTGEVGYVGYNEFCAMLRSDPSWTIRRDFLANVPYAVNGLNWVSYDDPESIRDKVEYALEKDLAGIMVWSIETDDIHNICGGGVYTLLNVISDVLYENSCHFKRQEL
nr:chitinase 12 [Chilo suppressalis]